MKTRAPGKVWYEWRVGASAGGGRAATHGSSANLPIQTQSKQTVKEGDAAGRKISNTFDEVGQA